MNVPGVRACFLYISSTQSIGPAVGPVESGLGCFAVAGIDRGSGTGFDHAAAAAARHCATSRAAMPAASGSCTDPRRGHPHLRVSDCPLPTQHMS